MITTRRHRNSRYAILLAVCLALTGYFSYHAVRGDHGLHKRAALQAEIGLLEAELKALKDRRLRLEHDVALMTGRVAEQTDLLDEQARALLNFAHPGDIIVIRAEPAKEPEGASTLR